MKLSDFDFHLPENLIAQTPLSERSASRLLDVHGQEPDPPALNDRLFSSIGSLLEPGDLLIFNDTKVLNARMFGSKPSGGKVEMMLERLLDSNTALVQLRTSHAPQPGALIQFGTAVAQVLERQDRFFVLRFDTELEPLLQAKGELPLPPYIKRAVAPDDLHRYQTVYAKHPGAVAAPTAGLHFTETLLRSIKNQGVQTAFITLHVGAGTFAPVKHEEISAHIMHHEYFTVPQSAVDAIAATRAAGKRVIAVGTTSLRALEANAQKNPVTFSTQTDPVSTNIFITPGYKFQVVDALITNFHLPKSTLLMLVSAFAGMATIRHVYQHAIERHYRFFSYGDAMFLRCSARGE
jgi:S-adenosylmethionine:tRNA ribosyltransferase-isomerase